MPWAPFSRPVGPDGQDTRGRLLSDGIDGRHTVRAGFAPKGQRNVARGWRFLSAPGRRPPNPKAPKGRRQFQAEASYRRSRTSRRITQKQPIYWLLTRGVDEAEEKAVRLHSSVETGAMSDDPSNPN